MTFSGVQITLMSQGVPPLGGVKQGWVGKQAIFEQNAQYIENGERYVAYKVRLLLMTNRKEVAYALSISIKIDDLR